MERWPAVGAQDKTDGKLHLGDATSHTSKLSAALKRIFQSVFMNVSTFLWVHIQTGMYKETQGTRGSSVWRGGKLHGECCMRGKMRAKTGSEYLNNLTKMDV